MFTIPRSMLDCGLFSPSHFTKYACCGRGALEGSLQEQALHEGTDIEPDLAPQAFVVGLEDHPLRAVIETRLQKQRQATDGNVLPFRANLIIATQCARAPDDVAVNREIAQAVDRPDVERAVLQVGQVSWSGLTRR